MWITFDFNNQQDGATYHTANEIINLLKKALGERIKPMK